MTRAEAKQLIECLFEFMRDDEDANVNGMDARNVERFLDSFQPGFFSDSDPAPEAFAQLRGNLALKTDEELVRLLVKAVFERTELAGSQLAGAPALEFEADVLAFEIQRVLIGRLQAKDRQIDALHLEIEARGHRDRATPLDANDHAAAWITELRARWQGFRPRVDATPDEEELPQAVLAEAVYVCRGIRSMRARAQEKSLSPQAEAALARLTDEWNEWAERESLPLIR